MKHQTTIMRDSRFELLRLIAMYSIVLYHLLLHNILIATDYEKMYEVMVIPLRVGVPVFVLISGYFGINPSVRGAVRFLTKVGGYSIIITALHFYFLGFDLGLLRSSLLFISNSGYWFVKVYFCLYLLSPLLNHYFKTKSKKNVRVITLSLCFISCYMEFMDRSNTALITGGRNVVNFATLYSIGHLLSVYEQKWKRVSSWYYLCVFVVYNAVVMAMFALCPSTIAGRTMTAVYPYHSPLLYFSSVMLMLGVVSIPMKSRWINSCATSAFAIYLIHENGLMIHYFRMMCDALLGITSSHLLVIFVLAFASFVICAVCIVIDKILSPIFSILNKLIVNLLEYVKCK